MNGKIMWGDEIVLVPAPDVCDIGWYQELPPRFLNRLFQPFHISHQPRY